MAHFAKLNTKNEVEEVVVIDNSVLDDGTGNDNEQQGIDFCVSLWGPGNYVQTSYNGNFRREFATIGGTYDHNADGFIRPAPYPSWHFDQTDWEWKAPVAEPDDADTVEYIWNEYQQRWDAANSSTP